LAIAEPATQIKNDYRDFEKRLQRYGKMIKGLICVIRIKVIRVIIAVNRREI
jgi:hypothetical protein